MTAVRFRLRSRASSLAILCLVPLLASAPRAEAGINVWTGGGELDLTNLVIAAGEPSTLYGSTFSPATYGWVYKSTDRGSTWEYILAVRSLVLALAVDPTNRNAVFVGAKYGAEGRVWASADGGATWSEAGADAGLRRGSDRPARFFTLAIDPLTPSTLYVGTDLGMFKSTDAARTWNALDVDGASDTRTSVYQLVIDPVTSTTVYAAYWQYTGKTVRRVSEGWVSKSTDGGATWSAIWSATEAGLPVKTRLILGIDSVNSTTLYAAYGDVRTGDYGVFSSFDAGSTWSLPDNSGLPPDARITALVVAPGTPPSLYTAVFPGGVFRSDDGGINWRPRDSGQNFRGGLALAIDPTAPTTVYASTDNGLFSIQQAAVCAGDCRGVGAVAMSDLITLVNIALGTAEAATCANGGLPLEGALDIAVIIEALNNALGGCNGW